MMTAYKRATGLGLATVLAVQTATAYATPQAFTSRTETQYVPLPAQQAATIEGLVNLQVSAQVAVKQTHESGYAIYNAQGTATGKNRFEYRVNIEATQQVERQVPVAGTTTTAPQMVTEYAPVTSYELRVWATPA